MSGTEKKIYPDLMKVIRRGKSQMKFFDDIRKRKESRQGKAALLAATALILLLVLLSGCQEVYAEVDTTRAVIHHTASHDVSAKEIDRWHKEKGWDGIGYHFVIRSNGDIEVGRSLKKWGAHAKGYRNGYVGIVLTGYDVFTDLQISSLEKLLGDLNIHYIERHHEKCPGEGLNLEEIL